MKAKISKSLVLPMLYGVLASWVVMGGIGVALMVKYTELPVWAMILIATAMLAFTVLPAMMRAGWVYSNLRRHHNAEYYYSIGNGQEPNKALAVYERRVNRTVSAWLQRNLLKPAFNSGVIAYLLLVIASGEWITSLWGVGAIALLVVAVEVGVWIMLLAARKLSYDKYGNQN